MIKYVPGFIAAVAAYLILKVFGWIESLSTEILLFFGTYLIVAVIADVAMKQYGGKKK